MCKGHAATSFVILLSLFLDNSLAQQSDNGKQIPAHLVPEIILKGHQEKIRYVTFSPDGKCIATTSDDGTARLWDFRGKQIAKLVVKTEEVRNVKFSADGSRIVTLTWAAQSDCGIETEN